MYFDFSLDIIKYVLNFKAVERMGMCEESLNEMSGFR